MEVNNPLYKNIGIHVICSLFTVDKGKIKVLLIKRKNEPFKDMWALVGGALYNNEKLEDGVRREVFEKTGLKNMDLYFSSIDDDINRSPIKRMVAINYVGVIDKDSAILRDTKKTSSAKWVELGDVELLAYNHNKVLKDAKINLKKLVVSSSVLKALFPKGFTMPELQITYESILEKKFDRRNFRKKILNLDLIEDTNKSDRFEGNKPAKVYKFKDVIQDKDIF